ncbi:MAG: transporter substrate-binding protein [Microcoleaceae cyanobacterium]
MSGVSVGILHSLSGTMAMSESPLRDAALMAIAEINQLGGVLGCSIKAIVEDGASNPACFAQKTEKLILQNGVSTLFGCWTSRDRLAVKSVVEKFNKQLWYPVQYEGLEASPNIFYTGLCANQQVEPAVNWLLQHRGSRFFLIGSDYTFPHTVSRLVKLQLKAHGGEVVGQAYPFLGAQDFGSIIARIRQAQPDVIFNTINGDSNVAFYRQFKESGLRADDITILATSVSETELHSIGDAAAGHLSCWSYFQSLDTSENLEFVRRFKAHYGEDRVTSDPIEAAYMQVYFWKQAVELARSFDLDRVRAAAYGLCLASPGGFVCLQPNQHISKVCRIGQAQSEGQFNVIYTSPERIRPLPWLGFEENHFNPREMVTHLLAEVSQSIERAEELEQKSIELEAARAQLQAEIEKRQQYETELEKINQQLEQLVEERTNHLKVTNRQLLKEIIEHQHAREELQIANMRLQTVLSAVPGTVSWIRSDLHYIEVNQRLADIFGLPREDFSGQDIGFLGTSSEFSDFVQDLFESPELEASREVFTKVSGGEMRHYLVVAQKYDHNQAAFIVGIDITQRRQIEEALRTANARLQTVLEAVPGTVSWVRSDSTYIEVNQRLADIHDLQREQFTDQHIGFLGGGFQFNQFIQHLFAISNRDASQEVTALVQGEQHHYWIIAQKYNQDQEAFVIGIDITARRKAEAALKASQDQLKTILEVIPGMVSWISSDLCYLGVNQYLADIFDLPPETFINRYIGFLDSSPQFNEFVRDFFSRPDQDSDREILSLINGQPHNFLIAAHKYNNSQAAFFVGIDITKRKQAEEALKQTEADYRSIFENAIEGIFRTTPDGRYLRANPALAHMYGYDSPERMVESIVNIAGQLYVSPNRRQEFIRLIDEHGSVMGFESQIRRQDGELYWISENAFAVRDRGGHVLYYEGSVIDITERKQAELSLQEAMDALEFRVDERTAELVREITERKRIEAALRASEAELRALFAAMTDVITVFDGEGRYQKIITTNSDALYSPASSCLGKTVFEVLPTTQACLFYHHILRVLETGKTQTIEYSLPLFKPYDESSQNPYNLLDSGTDEVTWFAATVSPLPDERVIWVAHNTTERKRMLDALQVEQHKSERLLQNILPQSIAERLKQDVQSIADRFDQATILFADIVSFTELSAQISPQELVDWLNEIFSVFDELAQKHHLEKIKTIGDSYMVAGGIPDLRSDHAEASAEMALEMQHAITRFSRVDGKPLQLRIGINTGPVVAGVIGTRKFIYDLWGDAVNVASRMESRGIAGKIQVTENTKRLLDHRYWFEERGVIEVKGKGYMRTYWLEGRR